MTATESGTWPGRVFGAARDGRGSVATMGRRMAAFVIDIAACAVLALSITWPSPPQNLSLAIWAGVTMVAVALFGATPGQWACGIAVASVRGRALVGLWAVPRTILTFLVIPVLVVDADGRGLHDRLCRTMVVRVR